MRNRVHLLRLRRVVPAGFATAVVVVGVPLGNGTAGTTTAVLTPVADTYVTSDKPTTSFGKATRLVVAGRPIAVSYLRFRVAIPAGATVERATLELFAASKSTAGFTVHRVRNTTWGEARTNYMNVPPIGAQIAASSGAHRGKAYVPVDVTPLVTHGGLVSLGVRGVSPAPVAFKSRESRSGRPRLVVRISVVESGSGTVTVGAGGSGAGDGGAAGGGAPPSAGGGSTGGGGGSTGGGGGSTGGGTTPASGPCGTVTAPPSKIDHVIWVWMENKPYDAVIGSPSAPYENELAAACGLATNYHGVSHPSLPNYIAATSGSTEGIADDDPPSSHPLAVASIYSQVKAAGKAWRDYAESAPAACPLTSSGLYAVKHDPAPYYTGIRSDCAAWDMPMGTTAGGNFLTDLTGGTLPAFSFVTPDLCNDAVVFVAWDEDDGSATNHVPLIVVNPSIRAGTQSGTFFDHYALLKTTEQVLGITTFLGHAGDPGTSSMVSTFNLG